MKYFIVTVLLVFVAFSAFGQTVDSIVEELVGEMTLNYRAEYPDLVFRPNIAVVPVQDQSPNARKYEVGPAITAILESKIERSIIFSLVTEDLRDKMLEEIKFSLSGLAEGEPLEPGQIEAIDYFLAGQVSEIGSDFLLSLKLIDVESGKVTDALDGRIPKEEVYQASSEYAAAYVSPYGIGIELSMVPWYHLYGDMADIEGQPAEGESGFFSIRLNYRISKSLVVWGSLERSPGGQRLENTYETGIEYSAADFNNIDESAQLATDFPGETFSYEKDRQPFMIFSVGGGYVFNITRAFNITLGAELNMGQTFLEQMYNLPIVGDDHTQAYTIVSNDISLFSVTPLIKLQYYITPRLAVHFDYGFRYQYAGDGPSQYFFHDAEYGEGNPITELYGLDPTMDPEGREHFTDYTGHRISLGMGFYF